MALSATRTKAIVKDLRALRNAGHEVIPWESMRSLSSRHKTSLIHIANVAQENHFKFADPPRALAKPKKPKQAPPPNTSVEIERRVTAQMKRKLLEFGIYKLIETREEQANGKRVGPLSDDMLLITTVGQQRRMFNTMVRWLREAGVDVEKEAYADMNPVDRIVHGMKGRAKA